MPTLRTRKDVETFAPWKAAPSAGASSPLRCRPSSKTSDLFVRFSMKKSLRICCTLGTRTPPPRISTPSKSSTVAFAAAKASSMGCTVFASTSAAAFSRSARVMVMEKSMSSCSDGMLTGIFSLAESTSLVFLAAARILAMGRGSVRTSPFCFLAFHFLLKPSAMSSTRARSMWKPPAAVAQPLPSTSNWPTVLFLPPLFSGNVEYSTTDACAASAPTL
mmetsp:Transcript_25857/g.77649  ORF Transcript_25857/g.77649 Transcript_25857/m.77649 type:complete len:219 (-) Transcript_25857:820-1476(-)